MPETCDDLVTAHLSLAEYLGSRFQSIPAEDAKQEAAVGLIDAARKFSPERGVEFKTFAAVCIRNQLRDAVHDYGPLPIPQELAPANDEHCDEEECRLLRAALDKLMPDVKKALEMRFGEDATFEEIGAALDCSHTNARAVVAAGLATLKRMMEGER